MNARIGFVRLIAVAAIAVTTFQGCTSLKAITPSFAAKPPTVQPVVDILALWQPGEGRDTQGLPTRGFAGQVFFFAAGSRCPIDIDGDVSVVVFDDFGSLQEQKEPLHEFHFRDGVWQNFRQDTNLGPAFQLFIPYTRDGARQARCSLRVKYADKTGRQVISEAATVLLAGETQTAEPVEIFGKRPSSRSLKTESLLSGDATSALSRDRDRRPAAMNNGPFTSQSVNNSRSQIQTADYSPSRHEFPRRYENADGGQTAIEKVSYQLKPRNTAAKTAAKSDDPVGTSSRIDREKLNSHWPDSRSAY